MQFKSYGRGMKVLAFLFLAGLAVGSPQDGVSQSSTPAGQIAVHQKRAHQLLNEKKPELAAKEFSTVLAADPNNLDAQANLGVLLYFQKDYAGAEPYLRSALKQQPDLIKIRALLGMCEHRLGESEAALSDLETTLPRLEDVSIQMEVGLELIEIDSSTQDLARAASVVETLRQRSPTDPRVLYAAYRIYTDLAGESLLGLSVAAPESGQMYQAIAHELVRQRDMNGAIADFRKALAADPNLPGIHYELAEALHASPDLKLRAQAEEQYKLALAATPSDAKTISRLGDLAVDKGNLDEATTLYNRALKISPNDADTLLGLSRVYTEKNDASSALPLLEQILVADPANYQAHYRLSTVYRKLKRPEDAKRELAEYQKYKDLKEKLRKVYRDLRFENDTTGPESEGRP
jgi:Tfp pilus assembly protein PilF